MASAASWMPYKASPPELTRASTSPRRIARRTSRVSASSIARRRFSRERSVSFMSVSMGPPAWSRGAELEPNQHPLDVREVADDLARRLGQLADQRGNRKDLVVPGELGILQQIDDFHFIAAVQVLLAD